MLRLVSSASLAFILSRLCGIQGQFLFCCFYSNKKIAVGASFKDLLQDLHAQPVIDSKDSLLKDIELRASSSSETWRISVRFAEEAGFRRSTDL